MPWRLAPADVLERLSSDDPSSAGGEVSALVDDWVPVSELVAPLSEGAWPVRCFEVLSAPTVLSAAPDRVDDFFGESLAAEPELDDGPDAGADDPLDAGAAQAAPWPVKIAAPIPRATASPPTRPTYLAAPMFSPLYT